LVKSEVASVAEFLGLRTDTPQSKCPQNYSPDCSDMVFSPGGMATRNPFRKDVTFPAEIVYRKEFLAKNGTTQILALDVNGALYVVHQDGTFTQIDSVTPGSKVNSVTAYGREYLSFFQNGEGCDAPRQWDGKNLYRVSQGGPGAPPSFSAAAIVGDQYPIVSITQPAAQGGHAPWGFSYFLQCSIPAPAPNSLSGLTPGNVVTIYYADSTLSGPDMDLVNAFNSGNPVYIYVSFTGTPQTLGPWTAQVTSVGDAQPPNGQPRSFYYFTFNIPTSVLVFYAGSGHAGYTANYQRTLATLTTGAPVPELEVTDAVDISGTSVAGYDGTQTITQTVNSGDVSITQSSRTAGIATYHYNLITGAAPAAGQPITITGTLNANGGLNGSNLTIASATGGNSGSFTVAIAGADFAIASENGDGVTAGTVFAFDPGISALGTVQNPIFGDSVGGTLTFGGSQATIAPGTRLGCVFFITDKGENNFTAPSPIVKFTIPANTNAIAFDNLPIGPANVIARGLAFTGANGGRFYFMDRVPQINGVVLGTATLINDNTTTSGTVQFTDQALFGGIAIDVPGNNLFQQVALNLPRGVNWYGDRMLWIGEKNTVIGFQNMDMAGGTLSGSTAPLGWTALGSGQIQQLGFMPAYFVTGPDMGQLTQSAYQTAAGVEILQPLLNYSLRFWLSGVKTGQLQALIYSISTGFNSTATFDLSTRTNDGYYTIDFDTPMPNTIPSDMTLSIAFATVPNGQTAIIRDMQIIYTDNPNRNPVARFSYVQNPDAYDALTGNAGPNDDSTELRATAVLQESLYFITEKGQYSIQQIGNTEPSSWDPQQVADKCGAFDANSVTTGKGWIAWAGPEGTFWFAGGLPEKISATIAPTWRQVSGVTNVFNDADQERVYFGIPGKQLVYDYHEIALGGAGKWCPWKRPVNWVSKSSNGTVFTIGAKFFHLDSAAGVDDDDLGPIGGYYTFAAVASGITRKDFDYLGLEISGAGILTPFLYGKTLQDAPTVLVGQELSTLLDVVAEWPTRILSSARRMFLKLGQDGVRYSLQSYGTVYQSDPNQPISGAR
jgi:hypothetical protein